MGIKRPTSQQMHRALTMFRPMQEEPGQQSDWAQITMHGGVTALAVTRDERTAFVAREIRRQKYCRFDLCPMRSSAGMRANDGRSRVLVTCQLPPARKNEILRPHNAKVLLRLWWAFSLLKRRPERILPLYFYSSSKSLKNFTA